MQPTDPFRAAPPPVVCYRHPDRRAGVGCQRCGRPICPSCMTAASVGFQCPDCVRAAAPQVRGREAFARAPSTPVVTYTLIALNVAVAVAEVASGGDPTGRRLGELGIQASLVGAGLDDGVPVGVAFGQWWRIVTGGFVHAGFFHLLMNMYALWILGSQLEQVLGRVRFLGLYVTSLLAASFAVLLVQPTAPTVGASGAVFGMFGVAFVFQRSAGIDPWRSGVGALILINLVFTFTIPGISIGGHVGGLLGGALTAMAMFELEKSVRSTAVAAGLCAVISVVFIAGSLWAAQQWADPLFG